MKKKSSRSAAALTFAIVFSLAGCGKTGNSGSQADQEAAPDSTDAEIRTDMDTAEHKVADRMRKPAA